MKLIETLKTFVAPLTNMLKGWTIKTSYDWKRTYEIFFVPTVKYNKWNSTRAIKTGPETYEDVAKIQDYRLSINFLTAYTSVALYKETPI